MYLPMVLQQLLIMPGAGNENLGEGENARLEAGDPVQAASIRKREERDSKGARTYIEAKINPINAAPHVLSGVGATDIAPAARSPLL